MQRGAALELERGQPRGDLVQARRNAWDLAGWEGNQRAPVTRETYRVVAVRADVAGLCWPRMGEVLLSIAW